MVLVRAEHVEFAQITLLVVVLLLRAIVFILLVFIMVFVILLVSGKLYQSIRLSIVHRNGLDEN